MSTNEPTTGRTSVLARLRQPVATTRGSQVGVGGVPQVSLLPSEVRNAGAAAHHRRRLVVAVAAAALVAIGGMAVAANASMAAQARLATANAETQGLNAQVAKFSDIRALQQQIALGKSAVAVGGSTMIDWNAQLRAIEQDMPVGYTITAINAAGATPLADYPQGATPLEPRRAATVMLTITSSPVGFEFSRWLTLLRQVPAYADATASVVTSEGKSTTTLTVHLTKAAIVGANEEKRP